MEKSLDFKKFQKSYLLDEDTMSKVYGGGDCTTNWHNTGRADRETRGNDCNPTEDERDCGGLVGDDGGYSSY